jgi:hypothetical protein
VSERTVRIEAPAFRYIETRFPPIDIFDGLYDTEEEQRFAFALEAATNTRLADPARRLAVLPEGSLPTAEEGNGASWVVAAFVYTSESGARFNGPELGAWYCALEPETGLGEVSFHAERRLRASEAGFPNTIQLRELVVRLETEMIDLRGLRADLYDADDHAASQAFARERRWPYGVPPTDGFAYDSVRVRGGTNLVLFRPRAVPLPVLQGSHYQLDWDRAGLATRTRLSAA